MSYFTKQTLSFLNTSKHIQLLVVLIHKKVNKVIHVELHEPKPLIHLAQIMDVDTN